MELRTLDSTTAAARHAAFLRAFADYSVKLDLSEEQLGEMHRRRGVRLDLSVGAFERDEMSGFTFNGLGAWGGALSGYDAGTGVVPGARRQGLASRMMERSFDLLRSAGASAYVLEVIQTNAGAFRVYEQMGFRTTRELLCWSLDSLTTAPDRGITIETAELLDGRAAEEMWNSQPSWQNSTESIARASEPRTILVARDRSAIAGYAVLFSSGDLSQFAVARESRRRGIGTALLSAARNAAGRPLRILNVDGRDAGTIRFLESIGATETVRQFEMSIAL